MMKRIELLVSFSKRSGILYAWDFASHIGLKSSLVDELAKHDLFPEPLPAQSSSGYLFHRDQALPWWRWLVQTATDDQLTQVAAAMRAADPRGIDYRDRLPGESLRRGVTLALLGAMNTQRRLRMKLDDLVDRYAPV